jgi:hypothetical protein
MELSSREIGACRRTGLWGRCWPILYCSVEEPGAKFVGRPFAEHAPADGEFVAFSSDTMRVVPTCRCPSCSELIDLRASAFGKESGCPGCHCAHELDVEYLARFELA